MTARYNKTERLGVNEAERIFLDLDWIPRGITQSDVGIDMEVEVCEGGNPTGQLIAVQIKSGKSFFEGNDPFYLTYIGKLVHLDYWLKHCLPVIIILYNPDTKITLWNIVSEDTVKVTGKTWKIKIPRGNHLDKGALEQIKTLNKLPLYFQRLQRLAMQKSLMKKIKKGKRIIVEMEVYANKMSGRATLSIKKLDEDNNEKLLSSGTFIHLHGIQELQQMYPWADFEIDDDYYYEHEYDDYLNNYGQYDPEEGCYMSDLYGFREYRKNLPAIRYIEDGSGELHLYRLEMSLNELGKGFMEVDDYLDYGSQLKIF